VPSAGGTCTKPDKTLLAFEELNTNLKKLSAS
jgi:hypothetical protein